MGPDELLEQDTSALRLVVDQMFVHLCKGCVMSLADVNVGCEVGGGKAEFIELLAHHDGLDVVQEQHQKEQAHAQKLSYGYVLAMHLLGLKTCCALLAVVLNVELG